MIKNKKIFFICIISLYINSHARVIPSANGYAIIGTTIISQPGKYTLAQDINNTTDSQSIIIDADSVELDLAGHVITGPGTLGINDISLIIDGHRDIIIKNGVISHAAQTAIFMENTTNVTFENISTQNGALGMFIKTSTCICIESCNFIENDTDSIGSSIISVEDSRELSIKKCSFIRNTCAFPISLDHIDQAILHNISIFNSLSNGEFHAIGLSTCTGIDIHNVRIANNTVPGPCTGLGLNCSSVNNVTLNNVYIMSNTVTDFPSFTACDFFNCNACTINNTIVSGNSAIGVGDQAGFSLKDCSDFTFNKCVVQGNTFGASSPLGLYSFSNAHNIICNNIIALGNTVSDDGYYGILNALSQSIILNKPIILGNMNTTGYFTALNILENTEITMLDGIIKANFAQGDCTGINIASDFLATSTINTIIRESIISNNESNATSYGLNIDKSLGNTILQNQVEDHDFNITAPTGNDVLPTATYVRSTGIITPSANGALAYDDLIIVN